jgi:hypothetical protein
MFDGKTFDGWTQRGGKAKYEMVDGVIIGTTVPKTPNSFLCTNKNYGNFVLKLEFKVSPKLNSGVQIRSQSLPSYQKGRVHGYQTEIDPSDRAWTAGLYEEGRRGWLDDLSDNEAARKAFRQNEWNEFRIECDGDRLRTWLNGVPAADLVDSMTLEGFIALQVHAYKGDSPVQVMWRNVRIKELGRGVWKLLFDGRTTEGWTAEGAGKWSVADGKLVGATSADDKRESRLVFKQPQDDFTVRVAYRMTAGSGGLCFHTAKSDGSADLTGMKIPVVADKPPAGLAKIGRSRIAPADASASKSAFHSGKWNELTLSAHGKRVVIHLNNKQILDLADGTSTDKGAFALTLDGGAESRIEFKEIAILSNEAAK